MKAILEKIRRKINRKRAERALFKKMKDDNRRA